MSRFALVLSALAAACFRLVLSRYSTENVGIKVVFPSEVDRTMYMAMADFGTPRYGGSLRGELVYPKEAPGKLQCAPAWCQYGCVPFDKAFPAPYKINKEPGKLYIMMLDRGPRDVPGLNASACFFVDKVYNAQLAGADAVLVANDIPDDPSTAIPPDLNDEIKKEEALTVSAGMIRKADADYLRELLLKNLTVTLQLSWSKAVPQKEKGEVTWEFWTSSADNCGEACKERAAFIQAIRPHATLLEKANYTKFTPRYFMYDCPPDQLNASSCKRNCVAKGKYCGEPGSSTTYTGKNILEMDIRGACFFKLAAEAGQGYLWWDYTTQLVANCSMEANKFTVDCAVTVFDAVGGPALANNTGRSKWDECSRFIESDDSFPILAEQLSSQLGDADKNITGIAILPSIRVNNVQYRGSLEVGPVLRALCAGFNIGQEPSICNTDLVSEDECKPGGMGYEACMSGLVPGKTRCVNNFRGWRCECKAGTQLNVDPVTGEQRCDDVNECLANNIVITDPDCSCDRCACINTLGSYKCSGKLPNNCTEEYNYGGCFKTTFDGVLYHGCFDNIKDYKELAARGLVNDSTPSYSCGCPKCFKPTATGGCEQRCDLSTCDRETGVCSGKGDGGGSGGGGSGGGGSGSGGSGSGGSGSGGSGSGSGGDSGSDSSGGGSSGSGSSTGGGNSGGSGNSGGGSSKNAGVGAGFLVLVAFGSAMLTGIVVFAANRYLMRQRMGDEIRDIMAAYMPLQGREAVAAAAAVPGGAARGPARVIRPDEDSDEEGQVGPYGWPAARPASSAQALGPLGPPAPPPAPTLAAASQRGVWGPPAATTSSVDTAAPGNQLLAPGSSAGLQKGAGKSPSGAAAAPARPAVDVFTLGGPEEQAEGGGSSAAPLPVASGSADPLLGLELGSSTNLDDKPAGQAAAGGARRGGDNPFL